MPAQTYGSTRQEGIAPSPATTPVTPGHGSSAPQRGAVRGTLGSLSSPHLEHLGLTGLRVRVLVAALLVVMLALPLGPDFGRSPLELAAALATFSWTGGRKGRSQRAAPSKRLPASEASSIDVPVCKRVSENRVTPSPEGWKPKGL